MDILANLKNQLKGTSYSVNEGDYYEDGVLCCGKCRTPKQYFWDYSGELMPVLCKCEQEALEREEINREKAEFAERQEKIRDSGFSASEMRNWTFANDNKENPKLSEAMMSFSERFNEFYIMGKGLLLWGGIGSGKTYMAACAANYLADDCERVLMTNFNRIAHKLESDMDHRQGYIDKLNNYKLLVLDDLGVERSSEYMQGIVFEIIDGRYKSKLPMIITTNMTLKEMQDPKDRSCNRIYDRILERCYPIEVQGHRRVQMANEDHETMKGMLGI